MLQVVLILVFVAVAIFMLLAIKQPAEFRITRSTLIAAPAEAIFPHINNLRAWHSWSPWVKLDPTAQYTFTGPSEGVDAHTHWVGNRKVGEGSMTIVESVPSRLIRFTLIFIKPMSATNSAEFTFEPEGTATRVTWSMAGENSMLAKVVSLLINCDKMVGRQFEKGLADLKTIVESPRH